MAHVPAVDSLTSWRSRVVVRHGSRLDWPQIWPMWREIVAAGQTHPYPTDATEDEAVSLWLTPRRSALYVAQIDGLFAGAMMTKPLRYGQGTMWPTRTSW